MDSIVTVTTAATTRALTTRDAVKADLAITTTDLDQWITQKIASYSAAVEGFCDRIFASQTYQETFRLDSAGSRSWSVNELPLKHYPVSSITSVNEDDDDDDLAATEYEVDATSGLLYRLSDDGTLRLPWTARKMIVTYVAGYVLPPTADYDLPSDISEAVLVAIKAKYHSRGRDPALRSQDIPGVISQSFWVGAAGDKATQLPPEAAGLLDGYVRTDVL